MKKGSRFVLLLALLSLIAFTSVGQFVLAQDATEEATEAPTPLPTATFAPSVEGTLTIWADEERTPAIEAAGAAFEAEYGIPVQIQQMGFGDIRNNLVLGGPAGNGPDIIIGAHDWLGQLYAGGLLAPIELPEEVAANFNPLALQAFNYEGQLYGLPYALEAIGIFYNTDLVESVPATWAETIELAQQVVEDGSAERGIAIPVGAGGDPYHHYPLFTGFGGYVFGRDAEGNYNPEDVGLDNEGGIAAMNELDRLVKADVLTSATDYGAAQTLFQEGRLAMWITGPWAIGDLTNSGVPFAVAPIPEMEETPRPFMGAQGFMINAFSRNLLLAQAFLTEFIATDEVMQIIYDSNPRPPSWLPIADAIDDPNIQAFTEVTTHADPMPAIPQMAAVWDAWGRAILLVYQQDQNTSPEEAIQQAAEAIRDQLAAGSGS